MLLRLNPSIEPESKGLLAMITKVLSWVIAIGFVSSTALISGSEVASAEPTCSSEMQVTLDDLGDFPATCSALGATVQLPNDLQITIPAAGYSTSMFVLLADSPGVEATVYRNADGSIGADFNGESYGSPALQSEQLVTSSLVAPLVANSSTCTYLTTNTTGYKWASTHNWRYNSTFEVNAASLTTIRSGLNTWRSGTNQCTSASYTSSFPSGYLGTTSLVPAGGASGCNTPDGVNVVGWRPLASTTLGITCLSALGSSIVEADVSFTTSVAWFSSTSTAGCSQQYDLASVATHEFGHLLGLGHAPVGTGQTMIPTYSTCQLAYRNLGASDLAGVKKIYP